MWKTFIESHQKEKGTGDGGLPIEGWNGDIHCWHCWTANTEFIYCNTSQTWYHTHIHLCHLPVAGKIMLWPTLYSVRLDLICQWIVAESLVLCSWSKGFLIYWNNTFLVCKISLFWFAEWNFFVSCFEFLLYFFFNSLHFPYVFLTHAHALFVQF